MLCPQVRPLVGKEKVHNVPQCVHFIPEKPQLILGKDRGFTFDYVFPPKASQVMNLLLIQCACLLYCVYITNMRNWVMM